MRFYEPPTTTIPGGNFMAMSATTDDDDDDDDGKWGTRMMIGLLKLAVFSSVSTSVRLGTLKV